MRGYGEAPERAKQPEPTPEQLKRDTQQARLLLKAIREQGRG
jgi:hypothetical protein